MGSRTWMVGCGLALALSSAAYGQQQVRIQFAEPVHISATSGQTEFDAYGQRFSLTLEANERLLNALPQTQKARLTRGGTLRGSIDGVPGSWVRLTRVAGNIEGAIWDGRDLYVVGPYRDIAAQLTFPLDAAPNTTVVYRLSDTIDVLPDQFCAVGPRLASSSLRSGGALKQFLDVVANCERTRP